MRGNDGVHPLPAHPEQHRDLGDADKIHREQGRCRSSHLLLLIDNSDEREEPELSILLGERLRRERLTRGLSQAEAGEHFGVSQPSYSRWETGETAPDGSRFDAVAMYLGCSLDEVWQLAEASEQQSERTLDRIKAVQVVALEARARAIAMERELAHLTETISAAFTDFGTRMARYDERIREEAAGRRPKFRIEMAGDQPLSSA